MTMNDHKATHIAAMLNAAGIAAAVVGPNDIAVTDVDKAREVIGRVTDAEHDELGITDREGTHIAIVPVAVLPGSE